MNSKDIIDILGSNVQCKLKIFSGYSLQYYVDGGDAEFDIYVSGDKGKGKVNIKLEKRNDKWQITMARLHTKKGSKLINLLR